MTEAILFALYLIPGFCFVKSWIFTRYRLTRSSDQLLIYETATYSLALFLLSHLIISLLGQSIFTEWKSIILANLNIVSQNIDEINSFYIYTPLNLFFSFLIVGSARLLSHVLALAGVDPNLGGMDDLERLLRKCIEHDLDACITLKSKKVYVGRILSSLNSPEVSREAISIIPVLSGFRDERQELVFTTDYSGIQNAEETNIKSLTTPAQKQPASRLMHFLS